MTVFEKGEVRNGKQTSVVKSESVHLHLSLYQYAKYQDPNQSGTSDVLFTRSVHIQPKQGHNSRMTRPVEEKNTGPFIFNVHATYKISRF